jgi:hypothetical protein
MLPMTVVRLIREAVSLVKTQTEKVVQADLVLAKVQAAESCRPMAELLSTAMF